MLKTLREYFDNSGKLIQNCSSFTNALPFFSLGAHIDNWLKYWYGAEKAQEENPGEYLTYINTWLASSADRLTRLYNALNEQYNPLENYSMKEERGNARSRAELETDTSREGKLKSTTTPASVTNSEKRTTDDGLTLRTYAETATTYGAGGTVTETEETGTNHGVKTVNKYNGTQTMAGDDITMTGQEVESEQIIRAGNMGVTTSQQMLQSEIDIRVANQFVKLFGELFERECLTGVFDFGYNY